MTISLTEIIAALEAKSNATDSSSSISNILNLVNASETVSDGTILYDSAGVMPTDSAFIGTLAATSAGTIYFYNGTSWNAVDSAETITPPVTYSHAQGSSYGYASGGTNPDYDTSFGASSPRMNQINKWSFSTDGNSTDVGDLLGGSSQQASQSSTEYGYTTGGEITPYVTPSNTNGINNVIQKFSFSTNGNASDVGDLTQARRVATGQSSTASGYTSGGFTDPSTYQNIIDKFPFSADANATDVGDLSATRSSAAGHSSSDNGYTSGGNNPTYTNIIDKFPFSTDANATDVGDLLQSKIASSGQNSSSHGYSSGGFVPPSTYSNVIQKFSFSADENATDVGDLLVGRRYGGGNSSTENGYHFGGLYFSPFPAIARSNSIEKFPFSTDGNATDVGDLTSPYSLGRDLVAGNQV